MLHAKNTIHQIHIADEQAQHFVLSRGALIGNGRLQQVPQAIQLVVGVVLEALLRRQVAEIAVKIAVFPLVLFQFVYQIIDDQFNLFIFFFFQQIGGGFDPLGNIAVPEDVRAVGIAFFPGKIPGVEAAGVAKTVVNGHQRYFSREFAPVVPKAGSKLDLFMRYHLIGGHTHSSCMLLECGILHKG